MDLESSLNQSGATQSSKMDWQLSAFDVQPRIRLVFGEGKINELGDIACELGGTRVLVVTDPGIVAAGHFDLALKILEEAGLKVFVFDQVHENPTTADVAACVEIARSNQIDLFVGLGGGSSMDTAKGCNFILTNGGRMHDYWGIGKASQPMLPMVAVPTTSGTGSECQSFALIADESSHQKMACGDPKAAAKVSILDPALTLSQPRRVTACTGMDALTHALETAVTRKRTLYSWMHALEAFKLLLPNLPVVLKKPDDLVARGKMQLGAALAGIAIENSMLGAAHATANPLTAGFDVVHGMAVGVMMPHVIRWNARDETTAKSYAQLARETHLASSHDSVSDSVNKLVAAIERILEVTEIPSTLNAHGVQEKDLDKLAEGAAQQWTGNFNPIEISQADYRCLYALALG
jgi:alcohol dehydrogenase